MSLPKVLPGIESGRRMWRVKCKKALKEIKVVPKKAPVFTKMCKFLPFEYTRQQGQGNKQFFANSEMMVRLPECLLGTLTAMPVGTL